MPVDVIKDWYLPSSTGAEFVGPITVTDNGVPVSTFTIQVVKAWTDPLAGAFVAPTTTGATKSYTLAAGTTVGTYDLHAKYSTAGGETVVRQIGRITVY